MSTSKELVRDAFWERQIQPQAFARDYWITLKFDHESFDQGWYELPTLIEWAWKVLSINEKLGHQLISVTLLREDDPMPPSETKSDS